MKRLLGAAVAFAGLFVGGSTGPVDLDYISYNGAPIFGYGGSANFGPSRSVLSAGHGGLAEFIDRGPEHMFAALTEGSSASASEPLQAKEQPSSLQAREQPSQPNVQSAYEPDVPLSTLNDVSARVFLSAVLSLGETRDGQENPRVPVRARPLGTESPPARNRRRKCRGGPCCGAYPSNLTTPLRDGVYALQRISMVVAPEISRRFVVDRNCRKRSRVRREHLPTGIPREYETPQYSRLGIFRMTSGIFSLQARRLGC